MGTTENFCLRWNDFESNLSTAFRELRDDADFFDVTLATDEDEVKAHKVVLSACSPHLKQVLKRHSKSEHQAHLLIYLRGVRHVDLVSVLEFMYSGEVNVSQEDLNSFLAVAEDLRVRGLTQNLAQKIEKDSISSSPSAATSNGGSTKRPRPPGGISVKSLNSLAKRPKPGSTSNKTEGEAKSELSQDRDGGASTGSVSSNQQMVVTPDVAQFGKDEDDEDGMGEDGGFDDNGDGFDYTAAYGDTIGNDLGALDVAGTSSGVDGNKDFRESQMVINCLGRSSDGGRPMCKLCGMTGADITRIKNHIESMHWQPQLRTTYSCELCGASCKTKHGLACHKSRHHSKKKMMLQQQAAVAASINQNGAGGVNLSTLAAAAAVQQPTTIINTNQPIVSTQASSFSADSVALAALAAVKEPIPLQTNLARVGTSGRASNALRYNHATGAVVMAGGGVANPAAAYIPIGGSLMAHGTSTISNTSIPLNHQPIMRHQAHVSSAHKGYATVSKPACVQKKVTMSPKGIQIIDTQTENEEKDRGNDEKIDMHRDDKTAVTLPKEDEGSEKITSPRKNPKKVIENPFVDEEVSNSPIPDPTPAETSMKPEPPRKSNKRKNAPSPIPDLKPSRDISKRQTHEKLYKPSPEKSKNDSPTKPPKKPPTRSKRGRKRY